MGSVPAALLIPCGLGCVLADSRTQQHRIACSVFSDPRHVPFCPSILHVRAVIVLYYWPRQNKFIERARRSRAGFHKFPQIFSMHCAGGARARGFDSLPSLSDIGTIRYFCFLYAKYQNGNIHRKLKVLTSVILPQTRIQYSEPGTLQNGRHVSLGSLKTEQAAAVSGAAGCASPRVRIPVHMGSAARRVSIPIALVVNL